jgi:uncharacterized membrane protein YqiK
LHWITGKTESHRYDDSLRSIDLVTKDAYEPLLPLSVVVHIDYQKAPGVIQRFGDVKKLVEQTLDPMVSAYFKNVGQTRTLIQLISERSELQQQSSEDMKTKFARFNLELEEVLIGTPHSSAGDQKIETILTQLRSRQIAEEQVETYNRQEKAAVKERELREAESRARQQQLLTESEISITVQSNEGKAQYQRSLQQAAQIRALAEAEGEKAARIGIGKAIAIEEQVRAYGGPQFQVTQDVMSRFAEAIERAHVDIVPRIMINGGSGGTGGNGNGGGSVFEALLTLLLSERMGEQVLTPSAERNPAADAIREDLRRALLASPTQAPAQPIAPAVTTPLATNGHSS